MTRSQIIDIYERFSKELCCKIAMNMMAALTGLLNKQYISHMYCGIITLNSKLNIILLMNSEISVSPSEHFELLITRQQIPPVQAHAKQQKLVKVLCFQDII